MEATDQKSPKSCSARNDHGTAKPLGPPDTMPEGGMNGSIGDVCAHSSRIPIQDEAIFLRLILDTIPEMIVYHDEELNIVWANKAAAAFAGLKREDFIGKKFFDVACKRSQPAPCENCPILTGLSSQCREVILNPLQFGRLYFTRSCQVICEGKATRDRVIVSQDISNLRTQFSVTDILNLLSEIFASPMQLADMCQKFVEEIARRFDYPVAYVALYNEDTEELLNIGEINLSPKEVPLMKRCPASAFSAWETLRAGDIYNVTRLSKTKGSLDSALTALGIETLLAAALPVEDRAAGALVLMDFAERMETDLMVDGLRAIASRLAAEIRRKQTEERLKEERNFTNAVLNNAAPLIMVFDREGRLVRFNKACEALTGYRHEEAVGRSISDFVVDKTGGDIVQRLFPSNAQLVCPSFEAYLISKNGEKRLIAWSSNVVTDAKGNGINIVSVGVDITERKRAEEELELRRQQLLRADKIASLGILASGVAHEINNPNNLIMTNIPIIRSAWRDASVILDKYFEEYGDFMMGNMRYSQMRGAFLKLFDGIENGSERIRRIIMNMKDYVGKDSPKTTEQVDMNAVVAAAVNLMAYEIHRSTQSLVLDRSEDLPLVQGNFSQLQQVIVNLTQNACQSLPDPQKRITLQTSHAAERDEVVVTVIDEGVGIKPELVANICDPFLTTKAEAGGIGLGLSICASIIREHHGRLEFTSEVGKGTRACVSLPVSRKR